MLTSRILKKSEFLKSQFMLVMSEQFTTRMVQLPATAAIEYVAPGHFFPGGLLAGVLLSGGLMPVPPKFNAYKHV